MGNIWIDITTKSSLSAKGTQLLTFLEEDFEEEKKEVLTIISRLDFEDHELLEKWIKYEYFPRNKIKSKRYDDLIEIKPHKMVKIAKDTHT